MTNIKQLIMTLVALLAVTTGAWAQTGENIFQYCYDCQRNPPYPKTTASASLSGFANPYVGYKGIGSGKGNTSDGPWKLEYMGIWSATDNYGINSVTTYQNTYGCTNVPVFRLYQWNATANEYQHAAYGVVCCYAKVSNDVEHTALFEAEGGWGCVLTNSSHSTSMNITFDEDLTTGLTTLIAAATPAASGTPVPLTRGTGDKINEWTLTNGMPAGNVLLTVAYKDRATMALAYGGTAITTEANAVTAFKGCEQEFAEALTPAVQNIEPTFNSGTAQDVTTTLAADFTFKSSDAAIIGFKTGETYADEGTLDQMEFRALTTSPVTLTVTYKGTDDLESKSQTLLVTIEKKTYTVSLADNTKDADSWKGNVNDAETDVNLPITKLEGGEKVTLKYNGRLKVKGVTATTDAKPGPLATPLTIEAITAGSIIVAHPKAGMQFSLDGGKTKNAVTTDAIPVAAGDKVQFYGNGTSITSYGSNVMTECTMITGSGDGFTCKVYGNIMSLVDEENFAKAKTLSGSYNFKFLFYNNTKLTDASGLLLPATTLQESCYRSMFQGCTALAAAPALPATQLADYCYESMFDGCSALTAAPVLPATNLVNRCYYSMFNYCSKLATVTCLATSRIAQDNSTSYWLNVAGTDVQGTKTVNTASSANWPVDNHGGIPTGWTRVNIDN